jgi:hypothetical protein
VQDKVQLVLETLNATWGPLSLRSAEDALGCVRNAITKNVRDNNVRSAIFTLVLNQLEASVQDAETFVDQSAIVAILQGMIDGDTHLYVLHAVYAHPDADDEVAGYCEHMAMPQAKRVSNDFTAIVNSAHELIEQLVGDAPDMITDCEVKIGIVDDGTVIPMGGWLWNRRQARTFWAKPMGRQ